MMSESTQFRRAVEAGEAVFLRDDVMIPEAADHFEEALKAALAELTNDICQTCKGTGFERYASPRAPCPNPDCTNGKVKPLLVEPDKHRAEVIANVEERLLARAAATPDPDLRREREKAVEFLRCWVAR